MAQRLGALICHGLLASEQYLNKKSSDLPARIFKDGFIELIPSETFSEDVFGFVSCQLPETRSVVKQSFGSFDGCVRSMTLFRTLLSD